MTDLGTKHVCEECETKFYDLGRDDAVCPQCGAAPPAKEEPTTRRSRKPRKEAAKVEETPDEADEKEVEEEADEKTPELGEESDEDSDDDDDEDEDEDLEVDGDMEFEDDEDEDEDEEDL